MLDTSLLNSIAKQLLTADEVEVEGRRLPGLPYKPPSP